MAPRYSIDVFGSCVTRDSLASIEQHVAPGNYIARSSVVSAVDAPIALPCTPDEVKAKCNFDRKCLIRDLEKTAFDDLSGNPGDYLVIDFIDERFPLGMAQGSYFTKSNEFAYSEIIPAGETFDFGTKRLDQAHTLSNELVEERFHRWSEAILHIYPHANIIVHAATFVDYYLDREAEQIARFDDASLRRNEQWNTKLALLYGFAKKYFPLSTPLLDYTQSYCADSQHRWGLATCHYQPEYYRRVADDLKRICYREIPPASNSSTKSIADCTDGNMSRINQIFQRLRGIRS